MTIGNGNIARKTDLYCADIGSISLDDLSCWYTVRYNAFGSMTTEKTEGLEQEPGCRVDVHLFYRFLFVSSKLCLYVTYDVHEYVFQAVYSVRSLTEICDEKKRKRKG